MKLMTATYLVMTTTAKCARQTKIVGGRDNDNGRECACEVVWVVGDSFVLDLLEAGTELVEGIPILVPAHSVHLLKLGKIEGVSIAVVGVGITTC